MNETLRNAQNALNDSFREIEGEYWKLYQRLGESYSCKHDQLKDMVRLGKLAESMESLRKSMGKLSFN